MFSVYQVTASRTASASLYPSFAGMSTPMESVLSANLITSCREAFATEPLKTAEATEITGPVFNVSVDSGL